VLNQIVLKKKTRTNFTSNINKLSLVGKVVEALGVVLEEVFDKRKSR
jgi:hypothetical protein